MNRRALTTLITVIVASIWAITGIDAVVFGQAQPFDVATTVMLVVVGFFMSATRRNGGEE